MQKIITNIKELVLRKSIIEEIYEQYKRMPQQSYDSYYYKMKNAGDDNVIIYINDELPCVLAFERRKKDGIFQSIADMYPVLGKYDSYRHMKEILQELQKLCGVSSFYFSQMDATTSLAADAILDQDFVSWNRLDCPVYINQEYGNKGYEYPKCCRHQHNRENRIFKLAYTKTLDPDEAETIIRYIESSSWKHICKQDMISRNQIDYYSYLIKNGILSVTALLARKDNEPIAYRIDSLINETVFVLKWSYNLAYAKLSPGTYLVTRELFMHYANQKIALFNLYGSPDSLKDRIENNRIRRLDLVFTNGQSLEVVEELKKERTEHDRKIYEAHENRHSLQKIYMKQEY